MNETILSLIKSPYIRFVSMTDDCSEDFYLGNLKKFSPSENIRISDYRKCARGEVCVTLKQKKSEIVLCDSSATLSPGDCYTFVSHGSKDKTFLTRIKEHEDIREHGYSYLKICYLGSENTKINLSYKGSCFCRDMKCGDVSKHINFVPGEYCFSIQNDEGRLLTHTDNLTAENGKCYTLYVTTDSKHNFKTLITTNVGHPEYLRMLK